MRALQRRSRKKHRPLQVQVDFLIPSNDDPTFQQSELIFLSKEVEAEFEGQEYVAVDSLAMRSAWTICKVGKWQDVGLDLKGRKVAISGLERDLQQQLDKDILVQSVSPPALETLVLKVSDAEYEGISKDHDESFRWFYDDGVVFRAGKRIRTLNGVELETTLCEPVQQGILGEETEIILVTDSQAKSALNGLGTPFSTSNESSSDLDITQFLALPDSQDFEFERETLPSDDANSRGIPFRVNVLERPVDKFSLEPRPADSEDDEFRVYANMRDVARMGVFSGDWVCVVISVLIRFPYVHQILNPRDP